MKRIMYVLLAIATIVIALIIRELWAYLPFWINIWIGDFLWAVMLYFAMIAVFMPQNRWKATILLIIFCWLIEVSQEWHTEWLDAFRQTYIGGLLLGHGFLWSDIISYTFGVLAANLTDKKLK